MCNELYFVEEWQIVDRSLITTEKNTDKSKRSILLPEILYNKTLDIVNERNFIDTIQMIQV